MGSAIERILKRLEMPALIESLSERVSPSDLTSVLLELMHRRAAHVTAAHVIERYTTDRFSRPPSTSFAAIRRAEDAAILSLPARYQMIALSPLVPFGTHRAMGGVDQNNVMSTIRGQEVAADPTNALALEAVVRRRAMLREQPKSTQAIGLAATQRVVRAQHISGPRRFAHFQLFGLVTAGRDTGALEFECESIREHVCFYVRCLAACGAEAVTIELSDFAAGEHRRVLDAARAALAALPSVEVVERPDRERGRGYYIGSSMRVVATLGGESVEIADGGFVDWTQRLIGSAKERCLISGCGIDRMALAFESANA